MEAAEIKCSSVQSCYTGNAEGRGGIYNFVTKRGACRGDRAKIACTQVETGSAITWNYLSCLLEGDGSVGEFYLVAITNNRQQADTGSKMIHLGRNTPSTVVSKGISAGHDARQLNRNLMTSPAARVDTKPELTIHAAEVICSHGATVGDLDEAALFYLQSRGIDPVAARHMAIEVRVRQRVEVSRMPRMIQDDVLIEVAQIHCRTPDLTAAENVRR
jgi:Fe-S cluster assembly protein SufB